MTAKEKKYIDNLLRKVHRQVGHRSNRKLVELLKRFMPQRGAQRQLPRLTLTLQPGANQT